MPSSAPAFKMLS